MAQITLPLTPSPVVRALGSLTPKVFSCKSFAQRVFDRAFPHASKRRYVIVQVLPQTALGIACAAAFLYIVLKVGHLFRHQVFGVSNEKHHFQDYFIEFIVGMVATVIGVGCLVGVTNAIYEDCSKSYAEWVEKDKSLLPVLQGKQEGDLVITNSSSRWTRYKIFAQCLFDKACPPISRRRFIITQVLPKIALGIAILTAYVYLALKLGRLVHKMFTAASAIDDPSAQDYFIELFIGTIIIVVIIGCIAGPVNTIYENCSKSHKEWVEKEKTALLEKQELERKKKEAHDSALLHRAC